MPRLQTTFIHLVVALVLVNASIGSAQPISHRAAFFDRQGVPAAVAIQADGRIVAAGSVPRQGFTDTDFAVMRFNLDGTPDASFGAAGRVTMDFLGTNDAATVVAIQPDGRIIVAGTVTVPATAPPLRVLGLLRLTSAGIPDASFGNGGKVAPVLDSVTGAPSWPSGGPHRRSG